jgi:hypothetical protein
MTVTIELPPDVEAGLLARAESEGIAVSEYLQKLVIGQVTGQRAAGMPSRPAYELPPEEWVHQFKAWVASHAHNAVVLPDDAMERGAIYGDRGL